jgi:hypothetical protein
MSDIVYTVVVSMPDHHAFCATVTETEQGAIQKAEDLAKQYAEENNIEGWDIARNKNISPETMVELVMPNNRDQYYCLVEQREVTSV